MEEAGNAIFASSWTVCFNHTGADSIYFNARGTTRPWRVQSQASPYSDWYSFRQFPDATNVVGRTDLPMSMKTVLPIRIL